MEEIDANVERDGANYAIELAEPLELSNDAVALFCVQKGSGSD